MATSRNTRPRITPSPETPLEKLPPFLKNHVGSFFALGSKHASRLQVQSKQLHGAFHEQALADRLACALDSPPPAPVPSSHFIGIIDAAEALPPALRCAVLERIPPRLCRDLHHCGNNMEAVISRLMTAACNGLDPKQQYLLLENISTVFAFPDFRRHFNNLGSTVVETLPMARVFKLFFLRMMRLFKFDRGGRGLSTALAQDPAHRISAGTAVDRDTVLNQHAACAVTSFARGLYLVRDQVKRAALWHYMVGQLARCDLQVQASLLPRLLPSIAFLEPQERRVNQFEKMLTLISQLPPDLQPEPVRHVLDQLEHIADPQANAAFFDRLFQVTGNAPAAHQPMLLRNYANALYQRPPHARAALFDRLMELTATIPAHARAPILEALACEIDVHPQGPQRIAAYDALFRAIGELPAPAQSVPAERLFSAIECLPPDETRHVRFIDAIDFIRLHPVENRFGMIDQLQDMIWCQPSIAAERHCLGELLQASRAQSAQQRQHTISLLYDADFSAYEDTARFSLVHTIFREVTALPKAEQGALIVRAAAQARHIEAPYMQMLFGDLIRHALALPDDVREETLQQVAIQTADAVRTLDYDGVAPGELPVLFMALVQTSDKLPVSMRLDLLVQLKQSLSNCPGTSLVAANSAITAKVNHLPPMQIQQFLDSSRGH